MLQEGQGFLLSAEADAVSAIVPRAASVRVAVLWDAYRFAAWQCGSYGAGDALCDRGSGDAGTTRYGTASAGLGRR